MNCEDAKRYLCCYLDGELNQEKTKAIEGHIKLCQPCRRESELLRGITSLVRKRCNEIVAPEFLRRRVISELQRVEDYRESGVNALDLIRWGTHFAQLYNTKGDLAEVLVPYLGKGLEDNELCVWVTSEMSEEEARYTLSEGIPGIGNYIDMGQLQIISYDVWYTSGGCFDCHRALDNGIRKYREALCKGYSGLRIIGNAFWLEESDWSSFMEYEGLVNNVTPGYRMLIMCVYKESKCSKDNIFDVMNAHKYVLSKTDNSWQLKRSVEM